MPTSAPIARVQATEGYGAKVVLAGTCYDDAYAEARAICEREGATFLHPYDDEEVIAGQGTIALEILQDLAAVDTIVVPAGGGGLLAGVATAAKKLNPRVRVIGVQAEGANAIAQSFRAKKRIVTETVGTIADGIAVKAPGEKTVELINRYADDVVTVSDAEIAASILMLIERCKQVVEPAGASSLAAILNGKIPTAGKNTVALLSGGNIDVSFIESIIERGLVARGRRIRLFVRLIDRPGSLMNLLRIIASDGANILTVEHDKLVIGLDPNETSVHIACEVGGKEHAKKLLRDIAAGGYTVESEE
jgi:threonine dehydratase